VRLTHLWILSDERLSAPTGVIKGKKR
jgi:hypothetical protein